MKKMLQPLGLSLAVLWVILVGVDFWQYQDQTQQALQLFAFRRLALGLIISFLVVAFLLVRFRDFLSRYVNGFAILLCALVILTVTVKEVAAVNQLDFPSHLVIQFLLTNLGTGLSVLLVVAAAFAAGDLLLVPTGYGRVYSRAMLLRIALGIVLLTMLLFLLGTLHLLTTPLTWVVLLLPVVLNAPRFLYFLVSVFWRPLRIASSLNMVGVVAFFFLLWWIVLNLVYVNRPFPLGFDAATLYVNLSSLIDDYNGLVVGQGWYNWSLFASLGYLLFDKTEVTLALSLGGSVLALMALVSVARRWLDINLALVVSAVFFAMPMVNWLSYKDIKVDLPLLFFLLVSLQLFTGWLSPKTGKAKTSKKSGKKKGAVSLRRQTERALNRYYPFLERFRPAKETVEATPDRLQLSMLVLLGVLAGFSIGIKLTAVLWLFVLLTGVLYQHCGYPGFLGGSFFLLGLALLGGLDAQAGLRYFHLSVEGVQWGLLLVGSGMLIWLLIRQREAFTKSVSHIFVLGIFSVLLAMPWAVKNAVDSKALNTDAIIQGPSQAPPLDIGELQRIYDNLENPAE